MLQFSLKNYMADKDGKDNELCRSALQNQN